MSTTVQEAAEPLRGLREQKKQLTRAAIHRSACELVLAAGLNDVTVDEICAHAGVSSRTFFNYFPSKVAAALGLPTLQVTEDQRRAFGASPSTNVVRDLCGVMADVLQSAAPMDDARESIRQLVHAHPELRAEVFRWLADLRAQFVLIACERLPKHRAIGAVALVTTALAETIDEGLPADAELAARLWAGVLAMCSLVIAPAER